MRKPLYKFRIVLLAFLLIGTLGLRASWALPKMEYQVKSAFISNFIRFIDWPEGTFNDTFTPIKIGIIGKGPMNEALVALAGKEVQGRKLVIVNLKDLSQIAHFQILMINPSEHTRLKKILKNIRGKTILTIGDHKNFCQQGGMINFYIDKGKVRFEVNVSSIRRENLKVSSKLLKLARIVE